MANIEKELKAIMEAEYGEEVRSSIHDALKAGNDEIIEYGLEEAARSQAEAERVAAENARAAAEELREEVKAAAEAAAEAANEAAKRAEEAATGGVSKMIVNFEEPESMEEPESGETVGKLFGKMKRWFTGMSSGAGSTLLDRLLPPGRVLISDETGKVVQSDVSVSDLANLSGTTGNLQEQITQLNGNMSDGAASTLLGSNLTKNRTLVANGNGKIAVSDVTSTELGYLSGVSGNIQNQITSIAGKFFVPKVSIPTSGYEVRQDSYVHLSQFGQVDICCMVYATVISDQITIVGWVPEGFRPAQIKALSCSANIGINEDVPCPCFVYPNGEIKIHNRTSRTSCWYYVSGSYSIV